MNPSPRLTVLMPTYNAASHLPGTLDALLAQTFTDFEVMVVDDCSTDNTAEVVKPYLSDRIHYLREPSNSGGPSRPRNTGFAKARGTLIALCDADDVLMPDKYERTVAVLDRLPDVDFVFSDCTVVNGTGEVTKPRFLSDYRMFRRGLKPTEIEGVSRLAGADAYPELIRADFIAVSGAMFRRSVLEHVGLFDESLLFSEAIDFWLRVARGGHTMAYMDYVGHHYRQWSGNMTSRGLRNYPFLLEVFTRQSAFVAPGSEAARILREQLREHYDDYGWGLRHVGRPREAIAMHRRSLSCRITWQAFRNLCLAAVLSLAPRRS